MRENEILTSGAVASEYKLTEQLARDIVTEETRKALLRSWGAWLLFLCVIAAAAWVFASPVVEKTSALWVLIGFMSAWMLVGRYLAGPAIRRAAAEKAARLQRLQS